tara:strand:- start:6253 stop:7392 length:1140 start_codon:yes stop_codon:yes gene_type:complete
MNDIPYGKQKLDQSDIDAVVEVLKSDYLTTGPKIDEFENKFANYVGSKFAVAVSNGTAALHLSALALNVNTTSKVITTPITFAASANCIRYCGGQVVFSDINPDNLLLDITKVEKLLKNSDKDTFQGIIPVNFAGYPIDMELLHDIAKHYGLWILEDACHSPGGSFLSKAKKVINCGSGEYSDLSIFSFHPVKHIACGEGGMITTNSEKLYNKIKELRTHGISKNNITIDYGWNYDMNDLGYNYRLTDIQCALGISQLKKAEEGLKRRREIANNYNMAFKNTKIKLTLPENNFNHAYHLYVIQVDNRLELYEKLKSKNIHAQVHYIPVHQLSYYKNISNQKFNLPIADSYYNNCLSLPIFPSLTDDEQSYVIENVLNSV